jgi:hypothetical protein
MGWATFLAIFYAHLVARFSWYKIPKRKKYTKLPQTIPNVHKIYHHLPLKDPLKFTQIWIFGLKTNHLATLIRGRCYDHNFLRFSVKNWRFSHVMIKILHN